jgi:hypothetical protein
MSPFFATNRLLQLQRGSFRIVLTLLCLGLAACGAPEQRIASTAPHTPSPVSTGTSPQALSAQATDEATSGIPLPTAAANVVTPVRRVPLATVQALAATTEAPITDTWQTYRNEKAGYTVEYPAKWNVDESATPDGKMTTTFRPASGGAGITVIVQTGTPQAEPLDMPNTHCQPVPGNRGIATRCRDTISLTTSTTIVDQGKTFTISTSGKGIGQTVYQHVVTSFTPIASAPMQAQADLEHVLFQPGDLPDSVSASPSDQPSPPNFEDNPPAATIIGRVFTREVRGAGSVSLLLYPSVSEREQAYTRLTTSVLNEAASGKNAPQPAPAVGDTAIAARLSYASSTYGPGYVTVIVFARCRAVTDIRINEWAGLTLDMATAYAKRLDQRLSSSVCP